MKSLSYACLERSDTLDLLSADLAIAVYEVTLRETKPQNWLDLELTLWKAISAKVEAWNDDL